MASEKTTELQLNIWKPTDNVSMSEFNENFQKIDSGIVATEQKIDNEIQQVTQQLAQKASKNEINTLTSGKADKTYVDTNISTLDKKINAQASGSPKGTYATLAALQTAFPAGNSNIYVVSADGKWYYWNGTAWTAGGVYQSTGVGKNTVDYEHLSFAKSNELFDNVYHYGIAIVSNGEQIFPDTSRYPTAVVVIAKLEKGKKYVIKKLAKSDRYRISLTSEYPNKIIIAKRIIAYNVGDTDISEYQFTAKDNENYVVIQVSNTSQEPPMSIIEYDLNVLFNHLGFTIDTKNLFTGNYEAANIQASGQLVLSGGIYRGFSMSLQEGQTYYIKKFSESDRFRVATYANVTTGEMPIRYLANDISLNSISFTAQSGEKYLFVYVSNSGEEPLLGITAGQPPTTGKVGKLIPLSIIEDLPDPTPIIESQIFEKESQRIKLSGKFNELYSTEPTEDVSETGISPLKNTVANDIYALYDGLVSKFPNHISKVRLGYGSTSDGLEDVNLPIYEYTIKPPQNMNMIAGEEDTGVGESEVVTILITSGLHGNEKHSVWALYLFIKQLLENHKSNELLMSIKSNVLFKVIPVVNPGGYNADKRANARGVNINRNFNYQWTLTGVGDPDNYSGAAPYSEIETRLLGDWLKANRNAHAYIDCHGFSFTLGDDQISYHISQNEELDRMYSSLMRRLSYKWKDKYFNSLSENSAFGYVNSSNYSNVAISIADAYHDIGLKLSSTIEIRFSDPVTKKTYSPTVIETNVELIANYILALLDKYFA